MDSRAVSEGRALTWLLACHRTFSFTKNSTDRFTISLDENLATAFDELIKERGYATRSEAVRDILPTHLQASRERRDTKGAFPDANS